MSASIPGSGWVHEPGLVGGHPGQRRDHDGAGLGLPPGIDDRAAPAADHAVIPHPGFGIDRLADAAQQAQLRQVVLAPARSSPSFISARIAVGAV